MKTPVVSICCVTYNHAPFIRKCLDGFLMQETTFPIEILIHDDCSTDGTTEIIREYEAKYPDLIFPLYEEVNQYQQGKAGEIDLYNYNRAHGKYIAYCEGDDYWTDPLKLQKQVDFMEANPEYSVCFHDYSIYNTWHEKFINNCISENTDDFDVSLEMFLHAKINIGKPLTMMFRLDLYEFQWHTYYTRFCDMMEIMHLLLKGKGRFLKFVGGQYNMHAGGVSTTNPDLRRSFEYCTDVQEMCDNTHDTAVKKFYINAYKWRIDVCIRNKMYKDLINSLKLVLKHNLSIGVKCCIYASKKVLKILMK